MNYIHNIFDFIHIQYNQKQKEKKKVILLGDGFFARGFLHTINHSKFNIIQIYRDKFINPQDIFYNLQRNEIYTDCYHIRDLFQPKITKIQEDIQTLQINKNNSIINHTTKLSNAIEQKKTIEKNIEDTKKLETQYEAYQLYTSAISRDGIPYDLISKALPTIEKEVNNILNQIVEFTVTLQTDGKNVTTHINYEDKKWPLELASGLERFISSLAIRVALINVSNLPRPNFIAIDEGFGCADADNLSSMSTLFSFLKTNFDFVWIISHLDVMRDMVDNRIEIKKENGFSKISFI